MRVSFWRALLPLLFAGACSFPDYAFTPPSESPDGGAGAPAMCDDGQQGPNETGIDCGGICKACGAPSLPKCSDGAKGQTETGVDCGGACPGCAAYQDCVVDHDCESGNCQDSVCQPASCEDHVKNGTESDKDCGGRCPVSCATDQLCNTESDCASGVCTGSKCRAGNCGDRILNGDETGIDCGGTCPQCKLGMPCVTADDCESGSCDGSQLLCVTPKCKDQLTNNGETDLDCGGSNCAPCKATQGCLVNSDCDSVSCDSSERCNAATCTDNVLNQEETDADCGGPHCGRCQTGHACKVGADCATGACQSKLCVPTSPTGARLDQAGWIPDASNTFSDSSTKYLIDGDPKYRWTSGTHQATLMWISLDMVKQQTFFTITLDSNEWPSDSGRSYNVYVSSDGDFSTVTPKAFSAGKPIQPLAFGTAMVGRFIKIELTTPGEEWWSVGELIVSQ